MQPLYTAKSATTTVVNETERAKYMPKPEQLYRWAQTACIERGGVSGGRGEVERRRGRQREEVVLN